MSQIRLLNQISQSECSLRDRTAAYETAAKSITSALKKLQAKAKKGTATQGEVDYMKKRCEAREKMADEVISEMNKHLDLLNQGIRGGFERMHGLLSYCAATGGLSVEAALLYGSLDDYLKAQSVSDRDAASRAVELCLEHGNPFGDPGGGKAPDTAILDRYESIQDPEQAASYYPSE
jgi:hypothetical protein